MTGSWSYEGIDVKFQSENLLTRAGGIAMANRIGKSIDQQLQKLGFVEGSTVFLFEPDGTFSQTTGQNTLQGSYEWDSNGSALTLKYLNHIPLKATVSASGNHLSLLFEASNFLSFITFLGTHSRISAADTLATLFKSFEG
ncbi:MAG: DUF4923 family protein, partial [Rikenellaceae bacterium]|nr:DUF4923 family protein [Rikenellaceae bacterium]